jgi:pectin lyase
MKLSILATAFAVWTSNVAAIAVTGAAEGFAKGVTGGGSASPVYPKTNAELVSYLGDSSARVIVLQKTFDFTGTEGTTSGTGCAPWGTGASCQLAINKDNWCKNYQSSSPSVGVSYDNAGSLGITVASKKTILGQGSAGVIKGKGLRIVSGKLLSVETFAITLLTRTRRQQHHHPEHQDHRVEPPLRLGR